MSVTINDFGASGVSHSSGVVPDPGSTAGTSKFLREDSTWANPLGSKFFFDLAPSCATLTGLYPSAFVPLSGGGDAVLSIPTGYSVDGKNFIIKISGRVVINPSTNANISIYCNGSSFLDFGDRIGDGNSRSGMFNIKMSCFWDSTFQKLYGLNEFAVVSTAPNHDGGIGGQFLSSISVSSQSNLAFKVKGFDGAGFPDTNSITLTQFSIEN